MGQTVLKFQQMKIIVIVVSPINIFFTKHISMERRKGRDLSDAYYSRSKYLLQKAKEIEMITDCIVNLTITPTWEGVQRDMNQSHIHCNHYLTLQRLTHQQMW